MLLPFILSHLLIHFWSWFKQFICYRYGMVNILSFLFLSFLIFPFNAPVVMKNTTWCVLWYTMMRIFWNPSSLRRLGYTRASSITSNGMNCEWSKIIIIFKKRVCRISTSYKMCTNGGSLSFLLLFRITFPILVGLLPLETILSLSLYGVLNQNSNNSSDSNKQQKGPELLGKVSMPLFDFRR